MDFARIAGRLHGLDLRARLSALSLFREAPKWDAAAFLLEALGDSQPEVRGEALRRLDSWIADFNRSQVQPSPQQLERLRTLIEANRSELSEETAALLRFSVRAGEGG